MADLEKAIGVAVDCTPKDHPDRAARLYNLGNRLKVRYERTGEEVDLQKGLDCFLRSGQTFHAPPLIRVRATRAASQILLSQGDLERAVALAREALQLLPLVCGRYLSAAISNMLSYKHQGLQPTHVRFLSRSEMSTKPFSNWSSGVDLSSAT